MLPHPSGVRFRATGNNDGVNDDYGTPPGYEETQPLGAPLGPRARLDAAVVVPAARLDRATDAVVLAPAHLEPASTRPAGWMWPAIAVLALVLGLTGGVAGSVVYNRTGDSLRSDDGGTGRGLDSPASRPPPPIKGGKSSVAAVAQELLPSTVQISAEYDGRRAARPAPAS